MNDVDRPSDGAADDATSSQDPIEPSAAGGCPSSSSDKSSEDVGLVSGVDATSTRDDEAENGGRTTMVDGQVGATEPPHRKSSIRPMPDWRSPAMSLPRMPTPMVVVYSGDGRRPRPKRDPEDAPSRPSNIGLEQLGFREPFGLAEDLDDSESDGQAASGSSSQRHEVGPPPSSAARRVLDDSRQKFASVGPAAYAAVGRAYHWLSHSRLGPAALVAFVAAVIITLLLVTRPEPAPAPLPRAESEPDRAQGTATEQRAAAPAPKHEDIVRLRQPPASDTNDPQRQSGTSEKARRVTIKVLPVDAKVVYRGVKHPGPPYEVEVPIGKRIALEVARKGFVTRRLVIDGSEPQVSVALIREHHSQTKSPEAPAREEVHDRPLEDTAESSEPGEFWQENPAR
jgi:hypothetical protein